MDVLDRETGLITRIFYWNLCRYLCKCLDFHSHAPEIESSQCHLFLSLTGLEYWERGLWKLESVPANSKSVFSCLTGHDVTKYKIVSKIPKLPFLKPFYYHTPPSLSGFDYSSHLRVSGNSQLVRLQVWTKLGSSKTFNKDISSRISQWQSSASQIRILLSWPDKL